MKFGDLVATVRTASATQLVVDLHAGLAGGTHTISIKAGAYYAFGSEY